MSEYLIWGSELSPFTLKLRALMECAQIPYRSLPADGSRFENLRVIARLARGKRRRSIARSGGMSELGEYPSVPFLIEDNDRIQYDSSALAHWLDEHPERKSAALFPEEPKAAFLAQLIDECFDEFGLYMVHHQRWVHSAATNDAGARLAAEFRSVIPVGLRRSFAGYFSRRQVRRLPYLFSVAPEGFGAGVSGALTPPTHRRYPATHHLLDRAWR
jgi:glutathione S-transferase